MRITCIDNDDDDDDDDVEDDDVDDDDNDGHHSYCPSGNGQESMSSST